MSFRPLNVPPVEHDGEHRYVHVIGASVFVDDRPAETTWRAHFIGIVDEQAWTDRDELKVVTPRFLKEIVEEASPKVATGLISDLDQVDKLFEELLTYVGFY